MSFIYSHLQGSNHASTVLIVGSFQPEGTGAPTKVSGRGMTIARADVGKYTITLTDNALTNFVGASVSLGMNTPNGTTVTLVNTSGVVYDSANRQITIQALLSDFTDSCDPVELDQASDGSVVTFCLVFSKSSLPVT